MQYHIFKIFPNKEVEHVTSFENFKQAKTYVKENREKITVADNYKLKMIFAATKAAGAKLLTTEREAVPMGDD